jgi:hypothetical protein
MYPEVLKFCDKGLTLLWINFPQKFLEISMRIWTRRLQAQKRITYSAIRSCIRIPILANNNQQLHPTAFTEQVHFHLKDERNLVRLTCLPRQWKKKKKEKKPKFSHDDYTVYKVLPDEIWRTRKKNTVPYFQLDFLFHFVCDRANDNHAYNNPRQQISGGKSNKPSPEEASDVL